MKKSLTEALVQFVEKFFQENEDEKMEELGAKSTELSVEIKKSVDEEQRMAMFVVLIPNEVDLHGDVYSEDEVESACNNFNMFCNKANLFHRVETEDAKIIQSFISPASFTLDDGREIKKGTWVQWWYFPETEAGESIWTAVKSGVINGLSIQGWASTEEINE